jgi:hypothetical protein
MLGRRYLNRRFLLGSSNSTVPTTARVKRNGLLSSRLIMLQCSLEKPVRIAESFFNLRIMKRTAASPSHAAATTMYNTRNGKKTTMTTNA